AAPPGGRVRRGPPRRTPRRPALAAPPRVRALDHPAPYPPYHHTDQDRRDGDEQGRLEELERPEPGGRVVDRELLDAPRVQELVEVGAGPVGGGLQLGVLGAAQPAPGGVCVAVFDYTHSEA